MSLFRPCAIVVRREGDACKGVSRLQWSIKSAPIWTSASWLNSTSIMQSKKTLRSPDQLFALCPPTGNANRRFPLVCTDMWLQAYPCMPERLPLTVLLAKIACSVAAPTRRSGVIFLLQILPTSLQTVTLMNRHMYVDRKQARTKFGKRYQRRGLVSAVIVLTIALPAALLLAKLDWRNIRC